MRFPRWNLHDDQVIPLFWWPVPNVSRKNLDGSLSILSWKRSFPARGIGTKNIHMVIPHLRTRTTEIDMLTLREHPHRRLNPLTGEWVLVSPHRSDRPWQGHVEEPAPQHPVAYDPDCYLCPRNARAGGHRNPDYKQTFVFDNDFAALMPDVPHDTYDLGDRGLLVAQGEPGICRVLCFLPRHDLTLATMDVRDVTTVVEAWSEQYRELTSLPWINHVQIFQNRGTLMGASNPHPHCQLWATADLPNEAVKELASQTSYRAAHESCLLCDYLRLELAGQERLVCENDDFVAVVPFWAVWPFETLILSRRHLGNMGELNAAEHRSLADVLKRLTTRYDNLFGTLFPYSMGFHQAPTDGGPHPEWHMHAHFYPPLLRSSHVRKFMVGYEMLGGPQRDITPESAAGRLRACSEVHHSSNAGE